MSRIIHSLLASSLLLASQQSVADLAEPGFDFVLNINAGGGQSQSQSNTDKDNAITKDLNNSGKKQSAATAFALGRLSYTLSNKQTQFFFGNSEDDVVLGDFKAELGISQEFDNGTVVTLAYVPLLAESEAWKDPYLTNVKRQKTDVSAQGVRVRFDNILNIYGNPINIQYTWAEADYEHDQSGQQTSLGLSKSQQDQLKRDGDYHQAMIEYSHALSQQFTLQPAVTLTRGALEGEAMAFDKAELQLSLITMLSERSQLATSVFYGASQFDQSHPIFNQKREDKEIGAFVFYSYSAPFNWENAAFTAMTGYSKKDSNINFYDEQNIAASIGMVYNF
ncbi:DUF2860 family protein [Motilimonas sp. 1_MG-2023]|uniref:DUF2860 family protein n=1 Tax=Motilimonas sp. 1_MG-2023 TaxID=3062672 RepID=UPI0026E443A1|nr:DUF2860 family protein [Motilimonas sp. 1_MG-2023]MDO6524568.1 DUF2860 family protein [Motilimonas sp. 1_MG-2023]